MSFFDFQRPYTDTKDFIFSPRVRPYWRVHLLQEKIKINFTDNSNNND
jgi:hypothetical protein